MAAGAAIPEEVRFAACHTAVVTPDPPEGAGGAVVRRPGWVLFMTAMPTVSYVDPFDVDVTALPGVVREFREVLRGRGRRQTAWTVPAGSPLHDALVETGMKPYDESPLQPTEWCMATVGPPRVTPPDGVEVRLAESEDDYLAGAELVGDVFGMSAADRAGARKGWLHRHGLVSRGLPAGETFLAFLEGRLVGYGHAKSNDCSVALFGSGVVPEARGRGV